MEINLKNWELMIRRATLNFRIELCQIKFENNRMISSLMSPCRDIIVFMDIPNDVIIFDKEDHDPVTLNFWAPESLSEQILFVKKTSGQNFVGLKIFPDDLISLHPKHFCNDITFEQTHNMPLVDLETVKGALFRRPMRKLEYYADLKITGNLMHLLKQAKSYADRTGKIYVRIIDGTLAFDSTNDRQHRNLIPVAMNVDHDDSAASFELRNFANLLKTLDLSKKFRMGLADVADSHIIHVFTEDESEQYLLFNC